MEVEKALRTSCEIQLLGLISYELQPGISNHVRIYAPEGLLIRDVEFDLSKKSEDSKEKEKKGEKEREKKKNTRELEKKLNEKKKDHFDERCFYIHLGPEESATI